MTVAGNIAFGMEMRGVPKAERDKAIERCRQDLADRPPARPQAEPAFRRAAAARRHGPGAGARPASCSCSTSRCPTSMPSCASTCASRSSACMPRPETTIVYVTHDQIEAMTLATRIAVLKDGELQQFGTPHEIYNRPANIFVADFMGSPAMNLLPATIAVNGIGPVPVDRARGRGRQHPHRRQQLRTRSWRPASRSSSASAPRQSPTRTGPTATPRQSP